MIKKVKDFITKEPEWKDKIEEIKNKIKNYSKNSYLLLDNSEVYGRMLLSSILSNDLKVKGSLKKYRTSIINEVSL